MAESAAHLTLTGPRPADIGPDADWSDDSDFDGDALESAMVRSRQQVYAALADLDAA